TVPYVARSLENYVNKIVGSGECVAFVREASGAPASSAWQEGVKVHGASDLSRGTAIATFENGHYMNYTTGNHAAVYLSQDDHGIRVMDQWRGQPVHERTIA